MRSCLSLDFPSHNNLNSSASDPGLFWLPVDKLSGAVIVTLYVQQLTVFSLLLHSLRLVAALEIKDIL